MNSSPNIAKFFLIAAATFACIAIGLGAFAAHGLKPLLSEQALAAFKTGAEYQLYHALSMCVLVCMMTIYSEHLEWLKRAAWLFILGIVLFSGSLYLLTTLEWRFLGPITPLGGLSFMLGWVCIVIFGVKSFK